MAKLDNALEVLTPHDLPCRVARVDHNNGPWAETISLRLGNHVVETFDIEAPAIALIKVVGQEFAPVQSQ